MVLHRRAHREADRVYVFLSRTHGKVELLAKGGAKILAKLTPQLESPGVVQVLVVEGRRGLTVAGVESVESFPLLARRPKASVYAHAARALADLTTRLHHAEPHTYTALEEWMRFLLRTPDERLDALSWYTVALHFLSAAGYGPELSLCVECRQSIREKATWSSLKGGLLCEACAAAQEGITGKSLSPDTIRVLRFARREALDEVNRLARSPEVLVEMGEVVESLLLAHAPALPAVSLSQMIFT